MDAGLARQRHEHVTRDAGQHRVVRRGQHNIVDHGKQVAVRSLGQTAVMVEERLVDAGRMRAALRHKARQHVQRLSPGQEAPRLKRDRGGALRIVAGWKDWRRLRPDVGRGLAAVVRPHHKQPDGAVPAFLRSHHVGDPGSDGFQIGRQGQLDKLRGMREPLQMRFLLEGNAVDHLERLVHPVRAVDRRIEDGDACFCGGNLDAIARDKD